MVDSAIVLGDGAGKLEARQESNDAFGSSKQTMRLGALVSIAGDILERVSDVAYAIEIGVVVIRIIFVPYRRVGRRIDKESTRPPRLAPVPVEIAPSLVLLL